MALIEEKIEKYLTEASEIGYAELDPDASKFITKHIPKYEKQTYFEGIHGRIVSLNSLDGHQDFMRFSKEDMKKMLKDKNVRWFDVKSIGF